MASSLLQIIRVINAPDQTGTTSYVRNTTSQVTTDTFNRIQTGDAGTVKGFVNATGVGTTCYQHQIMMEPMTN